MDETKQEKQVPLDQVDPGNATDGGKLPASALNRGQLVVRLQAAAKELQEAHSILDAAKAPNRWGTEAEQGRPMRLGERVFVVLQKVNELAAALEKMKAERSDAGRVLGPDGKPVA
jgi:hypothetical protein